MNGSPDIPIWALAVAYALLLIPLGIAWYFRVRIIKRMLVAVLRMTVQLSLVGVVLIYLFRWNNSWLNLLWILIVIAFATGSAITNSDLKYKAFSIPIFFAIGISGVSILLFFNAVLLNLENIFTAQYLVVIGGMLFGNALKGVIIGVSNFYQTLRKDEKRYRYHLALGATKAEALIPFFRDAMKASLSPSIASMATLGVVFLPGMMTGQIIEGATPDTAIRYQLAIMVAVFVCIAMSMALTVLFSVRSAFDGFGMLKKNIFRKEK